MLSEVRRYLVYTDRGEAAADFEARMALAGAAPVDDHGDGRKYYLWTDQGDGEGDIDARFDALAIAPVSNLGVANQRCYVYTMKGEAAADFERRLLVLQT
jgi:hypothetical protein